MARAIADLFGPHSPFWDFVYPAVVFSLGVAAAAAIVLEISGS